MSINKALLFALVMVFGLSLNGQTPDSPTETPTTVKIEIWSDVVCPFCYLGKKKVEQAVQKLNAEDKVEIVWHSFQLDPEFPTNTSVPSIENLSERKGYPIDQVREMCASLTQQGKGYQIEFAFEKALTFNTNDAHRLIQWGKTLGKGSELKEALMQAYFSEGTDLSQQENLLAVVEKVGLDKEKAQSVLESDVFAQDVQQDIYRSQQLGIRGVPFFLINGETAISGAQADPVFEQAIGEALQGL